MKDVIRAMASLFRCRNGKVSGNVQGKPEEQSLKEPSLKEESLKD
ncbi:hypothetical protein ACNJX9_30290 [Bradyrhizobium sp. DASA03076]